MYADNSCQSNLQSDLNNFQTWCSDNLLDLNGSKCKVITFCRVNTQYATYTLSDGVLLDPCLKFADHISSMRNKAMGALGFIKRWSKELDDPYITKTLFISLVRPNTEFMLIVSNLYRGTFCYLL